MVFVGASVVVVVVGIVQRRFVMVQMLPPFTIAASFVPFAEEVISHQFFVAPTDVSSVQFAPLLLDVHMLPPHTVAASFIPSAEEVT